MVQAHIIVGSMYYPAIKSLFLSEPLGVLCGNAKKARLLSCSFCRIYGLTNKRTVMQAKIKIENISQSVRETANEPFDFQVKQSPIVRMRL